MRGLSGNLTWTVLLIVLAFIAVAAANTFFLSSVSQIVCPMDQYEKQMTKAYKERIGTQPAKRDNTSVNQINAKIMRCTGWTRNLIEAICLFLVGAGTAYGLSSMYWYLYVLLVPLVLNIKRIFFAMLNEMKTPLGQSILYTDWFQSLGLMLFIASLAGGSLYNFLNKFVNSSSLPSSPSFKPEPIDQEWWVYFEGDVIDKKFSRRELINLELFNEDLQVCREGEDSWARVVDDPLLSKFVGTTEETSTSNKLLETHHYILIGLVLLLGLTVGLKDDKTVDKQVKKASKTSTEKKSKEVTDDGQFRLETELLCDPPSRTKRKGREKLANKGIKYSFNSFYKAVENKNESVANIFAQLGIINGRKTMELYDKEVHAATILHHRAAQGDHPIVDNLINCYPDEAPEAEFGNSPITPMHFAAYSGNTEIAKKFLANGWRINFRYEQTTRDPLHYAIIGKNQEMVELLLRAGAKVDPPKDTSAVKTPMDLALSHSGTELVSLLDRHLKKYELMKNDPLFTHQGFSSCEQDPYETHKAKKWLRQKGIDLTFDNFLGAVKNKNIEVAKKLLTAGLITRRGPWTLHGYKYKDVSLLHVMTSLKYRPMTKRFIRCALEWKHVDSVKNPDRDVSILHFAAYHGNFGLIKEMLSKKVLKKFDTRDSNGLRPLHFAVLGRNVDIVRFLLLRGAKTGDEQNLAEIESPIQLARNKNYTRILSLLEEYS